MQLDLGGGVKWDGPREMTYRIGIDNDLLRWHVSSCLRMPDICCQFCLFLSVEPVNDPKMGI